MFPVYFVTHVPGLYHPNPLPEGEGTGGALHLGEARRGCKPVFDVCEERGRFGEGCRVVCGSRPVRCGGRSWSAGNVLVEFGDGERVVAPRHAVRRLKLGEDQKDGKDGKDERGGEGLG